MRRSFDAKAALRELIRNDSSEQFDISINYQGDWHYRGSKIDRIELVQLFASILHRADDGSFWLITPVERGRIKVADAPFVINSITTGPIVRLQDNLARWHELRDEEQLVVRQCSKGRGAVPYIQLDNNLEARLSSSVYYELAELATEREGRWGILSNGMFFDLGQVS